ncbi:MAG: aminotransferase class I/II-fold pyridoxal phosphate-dependent enzyme, partial [Candidatus Dormiibacterota bacterium]
MSFVESPTLATDKRIRARIAAGERVLHLAFGEAGLPVLPDAAQALAAGAHLNSYGPVAGSEATRSAVAGYWNRRSLPTDPESVILAPGSKAILYALLMAVPGDVILPQPSWVSYGAQALIAGHQAIWVPTLPEAGGIPDPELLEATILSVQAEGRRPGCLIVTLPDNPTGTLAGRDLVEAVCGVADQHGIAVISDEIYRDLAYQPEMFYSPVNRLPERTVVTTGLSKSVALGGWRIGAARFPDSAWGRKLREDVVAIASELWSSLAGPMQAVAAHLFDEPASVTEHIAASRRLHGSVALAMYQLFLEAGAECRTPQGAFYLYPDFAPLRVELGKQGISSSESLSDYLLRQRGVAVLAGTAFGEDSSALRFRAASSLLYGKTDEQRWQALSSSQPCALPWIRDSLIQLTDALAPLRA